MNRSQQSELARLLNSVTTLGALDKWETITRVTSHTAAELKIMLQATHDKWEWTPLNLRCFREKEYEEDVYQLEVAIAALDEVYRAIDFHRIARLLGEAEKAMGKLAGG